MSYDKVFSGTQEIIKREQVWMWVQQLGDPVTRGNALQELNKRQEVIPDLGVILWNSFGTIAVLIQEIINIYPCLITLTLPVNQSNRVCSVLCLLRSVASHPETKTRLAQADIPTYIYPFLKLYRRQPYKDISMASLMVLESLVKNSSEEAVRYLLPTDIMLHIIEVIEKDSSQTLAFSILQGIIAHEEGLMRICDSHDRFSRTISALGNVVNELAKDVTAGAWTSDHVGAVLSHVVHCYLRLSDNGRAREALRRCLPLQLRDGTFTPFIDEELSTKCALTQLLNILSPCPFIYEIQLID